MLNEHVVANLAQELDAAEKAVAAIRQFSQRHPDMDIFDAYRIQQAWVEQKISAGHKKVGHKIGLTSKAMQRFSNINEPDYGTLLDTMRFEDGATLPTEKFIVPRIEVELAFLLKKDLRGPNCEIWDVLEATEWVMPALELIDARIERVDRENGITRKVLDTISDNAANAGYITGGRPVRADSLDLRRVTGVIYKNGVIEDSGVSAAVLNHPAKGVAWLANKLYPHGQYLAAGEVILGGSFTSPIPAFAGDVFHVDYGDLGAISCAFSQGAGA